MAHINDNRLGEYLRNRRTKLDPASFGFSGNRRRAAGLRREEVAQRANISATWYTWLEQGRGGNASADVLDRIAEGADADRCRARTPVPARSRPSTRSPLSRQRPDPHRGCSARLMHWPTARRSSGRRHGTWSPGTVPPRPCSPTMAPCHPNKRNVLRMIFGDPRVRAAQFDWDSVARYVVGAFRIDAARAGAEAEVQPLVDENCAAPVPSSRRCGATTT